MYFLILLYHFTTFFHISINRALTGKDRAHPLLPKMPPLHGNGPHKLGNSHIGDSTSHPVPYPLEGKKQFLKKLKVSGGYTHNNDRNTHNFQGDIALSNQNERNKIGKQQISSSGQAMLNTHGRQMNQGHQRYQSYNQYQNKPTDVDPSDPIGDSQKAHNTNQHN